MTTAQIAVTLVGFGVLVFIPWFFFFSARERTQATVSTSGLQEVLIRVKGGYNPDIIMVEAGRPVRLNFLREETAACSERVILGDFNKSALLPPGETVPIDFTPEEPGEYEFACQMGMFRGKLIVE